MPGVPAAPAHQGRAPKRRFTIAEKLALVEQSRELSVAQAAAALGVSRRSVGLWRRSEEQLRQARPAARRLSRAPIASAGRANSASAIVDVTSTPAENRAGDQPPSPPMAARASVVAASQATPRSSQASDGGSGGTEDEEKDGNFSTSAVTSPPSTTRSAHRHPASLDFVLVGFLGQRGTPSECAARTVFPTLQTDAADTARACETVGFPTTSAIMDAVQRRHVEFGVLPTAMLLSLQFDASLRELMSRPLKLVGELSCQVQLCLCAVPGSALCDCDCVISDFATLAEFESTIAELEAGRATPIMRQAAWDNAGACRTVHEQGARNIAVITTVEAALAEDMEVLKDDISPTSNSSPNFLVIGAMGARHLEPSPSRVRVATPNESVRKATLVASVRNQSQWLAKVARVFADLGLHVVEIQTRIDSAPPPRDTHRYVSHPLLSLPCPAGLAFSLRLTPFTALIHCQTAKHSDVDHQILVSYLTSGDVSMSEARVRHAFGAVAFWVHVLGTYTMLSTNAAAAGAAVTTN